MQKTLEKLSNPIIFVLAAAMLRLAIHNNIPNFAPITAVALFGGAYLGRRSAIALPLAAMFITDLFIGFDSITSRLTVYGSFAAIGLIGMWLKNHKSFQTVTLAAISSSVLFFITTNLGVWIWSGMYAHTIAGLQTCFIAAIPFFRNTLMGDLVFTGAFFGGYELVSNFAMQKKLAKVEVK